MEQNISFCLFREKQQDQRKGPAVFLIWADGWKVLETFIWWSKPWRSVTDRCPTSGGDRRIVLLWSCSERWVQFIQLNLVFRRNNWVSFKGCSVYTFSNKYKYSQSSTCQFWVAEQILVKDFTLSTVHGASNWTFHPTRVSFCSFKRIIVKKSIMVDHFSSSPNTSQDINNIINIKHY